MQSQEIRRAFLKYFKDHGHTIVPSSPVVPHDDPTLLFINAGMNQFKDVFLGKSKRDYTRAATTQKCIRVGGKHNDLENVGHTSRHLTFFEMIGNFSFGDYFKKEAIDFAWEVTSKVYGFDVDKVWVSVFEKDDEAFDLWKKHLPEKRIVRLGEKDNFWAMGDTGPCGPCSELLFDRGEKYGHAKSPKEDASGERYLEFWNLVFMQFSKFADGRMENLPKQSIDTGAGLERVVSLKMGVDNVFQTDILRSLIAQTENISGKKYGGELAPAFHVIADHVRSLSFAIADGVQPSNTDRGYVLRKILRRAVRYGRMLGLNKPFLADVFPRLVETMGNDFHELKAASGRICEILTLEEEAFLRTLARGGQLLGQVIERSRKEKQISGEDAFKLKDTYGLPLEEVTLIAKDEGMKVDLVKYAELEEEAKEKSKKAHKTTAQGFDENFFSEFAKSHKPTVFDGYGKEALDAVVVGIVVDGKFVEKVGEGVDALLILDKTPFYAEMGGQVGDSGTIGHFQVSDCTAPYPGVVAHSGVMGKGVLKKGDKVHAAIDGGRRREIQNNHTATHIMHWALQQVLGGHIKQAGSLVDDKRLRFDFSHHKGLSKDELQEIERLVNEKIRTDAAVGSYELKYDEAQKRADIKQFFGEKYGAHVRVIDIDFSKELCGGTHTSRVGTIGLFKIVKESSIAAGVRRIEAATGRVAEAIVNEEAAILEAVAEILKAPKTGVVEKLQGLLEDQKLLEREVKELRRGQLKQLITKCLSNKQHVGTIYLIAEEVAVSAEELTEFATDLMQQMKSGVVALGSKSGEKCQLLVAVSPDLVEKNINAQKLIKEAAPFIQGGGGGKQNLAQAGGKDPLGLPKALEKIRHILEHGS